MATKKSPDTTKQVSNTNRNNNTNNNNVNVHVNVEQPKTNTSSKTNWVVKAIIWGIIGLALSLLGYYIKKSSGKGRPATVENCLQTISTDIN